MAVNQGPSLRRLVVTSEPKQSAGDEQAERRTRKGKSAKKSQSEAVRRDAERCQLQRMCLLFKAPRNGWTRKEVLSLGEIAFLIDEHDESLTKIYPSRSVPPLRLRGISTRFRRGPPHRNGAVDRLRVRTDSFCSHLFKY